MTYLAPRRTHLLITIARTGKRFALFGGMAFVAVSSAPAQTLIGGTRAPSVSVDASVLDQLGPAPNLPQLFSASRPGPSSEFGASMATPTRTRPPQPAASAAEKRNPPVTRHVAQRRSTKKRTQVAALHDRSIHLVPPAAQPGPGPRATRDEPAVAPPQPTVASTGPPAPAPMPVLPQNQPPPAPPVVAPAPPHEEAASPPPPAPARTDNAPVSLTASQPPPAPPPPPAGPQAPTSNNAIGGAARPAPVQVASAASAGSIVNTIKFAGGATDLPSGAQSVLDTVAAKMLADESLRVQLIAHASGSADQAMEARRVSLARAVAVRAYLIDKGVRSLRMDVRALGNRADDGPPTDQVDLLIVSQ